MDFNIRQEQIKDYEAVHKVVELAFRDMEDSDHNEPFLVDQLRQTDAFIPFQFSLNIKIGGSDQP